MKRERKVDPLLCYVHHARNSAEHGISSGGQYAHHAVSFTAIMKPGTMVVLRLTPEGIKSFSTDPDIQPQHVEDDVALVSVRDRGELYHPPTTHLGVLLVAFGATEVGRLAVEYVERMLAGARSLAV